MRVKLSQRSLVHEITLINQSTSAFLLKSPFKNFNLITIPSLYKE